MECNQATIFFGPHVGWVRFASMIRSATSMRVALGWL